MKKKIIVNQDGLIVGEDNLIYSTEVCLGDHGINISKKIVDLIKENRNLDSICLCGYYRDNCLRLEYDRFSNHLLKNSYPIRKDGRVIISKYNIIMAHIYMNINPNILKLALNPYKDIKFKIEVFDDLIGSRFAKITLI